ncbi:MAG: hypothetical protein ABMA15_15520 [Vicinamibacterales bacterium]
MTTPHLPVIQMIPQRHTTDCSVATLAMLLGVSYEVALLAIRLPRVLTHGVQLRIVRQAAKRLGHPLQLRRQIDAENDTGILGVVSQVWDFEHLVILKEGIIVDAQDTSIWDFDSYMAAHQARAVSLLTLEEGR